MTEPDCKTLWMGDVQINWDEAYVSSLFDAFGHLPTVKLIRDKVTGYPAGYGFLEFDSPEAASEVLSTLNGQPIPNTPHRFRLNWGAGGKRLESMEDHSVFVGDLAGDVTDDVLFSTFSAKYASVRGAKVVLDQMSRISKGFGFVRFGVKAEADQALQQMHGELCLKRPMRVSAATDRPKHHPPTTPSKPPPSPSPEDETNTTVFVGGLDASITEDDLRKQFSSIGSVLSIKIPLGRGCGFVQYSTRALAEQAIQEMSGVQLGASKLRCAWGRPTINTNHNSSNSSSSSRAPVYPYPPSAMPIYGYPPYQYYAGPYPAYSGYTSPVYAGYPLPGYMHPYGQIPLPTDDNQAPPPMM
ncbi:hypothetical protein SPRG_16633 [Saprolegnia parasitica CBS 223.65]|uniref:RRM domain-containing protein n=1 Tax=Saprolegnia parasitica (strain CBS 223.65) TaxID=695850 RepID=A0A067BMI6_SAPPC|nr:hypothetical protein SPRG_16633 [Saprolegnia parasitica CBS 223.65]KDO17960.1 hypothetical protein SPRG_16633 [Saprolegnia parasitica CBS 223.65]|eukprot:XP_012211329.1 hypothetical protein SPRG_16633 [Saprolegnia parasitica CBS 223.65]